MILLFWTDLGKYSVFDKEVKVYCISTASHPALYISIPHGYGTWYRVKLYNEVSLFPKTEREKITFKLTINDTVVHAICLGCFSRYCPGFFMAGSGTVVFEYVRVSVPL